MNEACSKVLLALDGSPAAETALPVAAVVAKQLDATLEIVHVRAKNGPVPGPQEFVRPKGVHADFVVIDSDMTAIAILEAALDPSVALTVLTTHGRTIEAGRDLGSVATAVIAGTTKPILLVRPEATERQTVPDELRHLLVPLDGTPTTSAVLQPAAELARRLGASLDLLHVADSGDGTATEPGTITAPRYVDQPQYAWPEWMQEVAARVSASGTELPPDVPSRTFLAHGQIGPQIARFARERHIDAIVLARRSRLEPGRAPVLRDLFMQTPCPILLVGQ